MHAMSAILVEQSYCLNCSIPGNGLASEVGILAPDKTGRLIMNLLVLNNESCGWPRDPARIAPSCCDSAQFKSSPLAP